MGNIVSVETLRAILQRNFGSEKVGVASIGGSATWGIQFPEGTPGLESLKVLFNGPVSVGHQLKPIPRVRLLGVIGDDGKEHPVIRVSVHGWYTARDGGCPSEEASLAVFMMLYELGVHSVIVDASVGAINGCAPRDVVVVKDVYLANLAQVEAVANRYASLIGISSNRRMGELYCPQIGEVIADVVGKELNDRTPPFDKLGGFIRGDVYANTPLGPFETPSMIQSFVNLGYTVVGQSSGTESLLARLSGMCFNGMYIPVNYGEGLKGGAWTPGMSMRGIYEEIATPMALLVALVLARLVTIAPCGHSKAILESAEHDEFPVEGA